MTRFFLKSMLAALTASLVALPLQARDTIQIVGSWTVYPFATVVAEKLGKKIGKTPVIESSGTGGGMKLFCAGLGLSIVKIIIQAHQGTVSVNSTPGEGSTFLIKIPFIEMNPI